MTVPKIIAQIVLTATRIFGRAFIEAYKEAAINAASQQAKQSSSHAFKDTLSKSSGMSLEEAYMILNVPRAATPNQILEKYTHLFQQNDVKNGGSFYLQSKIYRAKERIDLSMDSKASSEHSTAQSNSSHKS